MAQVSININGRQYGISCDDGQEQRVRDLATYINASVGDIASAGAAQNEAHLLVLAALVLTDEVFELKEKNKTLNTEIERLTAEKDIPVVTPDSTTEKKDTTTTLHQPWTDITRISPCCAYSWKALYDMRNNNLLYILTQNS